MSKKNGNTNGGKGDRTRSKRTARTSDVVPALLDAPKPEVRTLEQQRRALIRARRPAVRGIELTGCPFADARISGLWLSPRLNCGPAHLQGSRLVWDPSQPVRVQLRELVEQTAKWRNRRGLHLVRNELGNIAEIAAVAAPERRRPQLQLLKGGLGSI